MKYDLAALPEMERARIKSTRLLLSACRSQLRGKDTMATVAFAEHAHRLQQYLDELETDAIKHTLVRRDKAEATVAAGKGGDQ